MNHIVTFYCKPIKETNDKTNQTDSIFKAKLEKAEHEESQKTIASNETRKRKFYINVSSRNTATTLNTNPNLLLKQQI